MDSISIEDLQVEYRGNRVHKALKGINVSVQEGTIFGFLGPNGAGKTTTIKTLLGLIPEFSGKIRLLGKDPRDPDSRREVGYMPEVANYYWYLTPMELLRMYAGFFGNRGKRAYDKSSFLLDMVGLAHVKNKLMNTFSKGMMQKVSLAQSLINDPELLILDEPTSGLDPLARLNLREVIMDLKKKGKTIFFSSHELSEVETVCDHIAIIKDGTVVISGEKKELLAQKSSDMTLESYFVNIIRGE